MLSRLDSKVPLVLLPIRIETRFARDGGVPTALHVRIYPDDIHIDRHDPTVSTAEFDAAGEFWEATWRADSHAATDPARAHAGRVAAWEALSRKTGAGRAAFVAAETRPPVDRRPTEAVADDRPLPVPPKLRKPTMRTGRWRKGAGAAALPTEWHVLVYQGDAVVAEGKSAPVAADLAVAPDSTTLVDPVGDSRRRRRAPSERDRDSAAPALPFNERLQWLFDYKKAEAAGMAVTVDLSRAASFDRTRVPLVTRLVVFGTDPRTPSASARALGELLEHHRFSTGAGFLPQGSPTNNTEAQPAADNALPYRDVREPVGAAQNPYENRAVATAALGVPDATFSYFPGGSNTESLDARAMQSALWPATLGYWLDTLLKGEFVASAWPADLTSGLRDHFLDFVRARGPLPALRVGRQPYGLLPVMSWLKDPERRFRVTPRTGRGFGRDDREPFRIGEDFAERDTLRAMAAFLAAGGRATTDVSGGLLRFLRAMWPFWIGAIDGVPHVGRNGTDDVLAALGMNATSGAVYARSVDGVLACRSGPVFDPSAGSGSCADVEALSKSVAAAVGVEYQGGPLALSVNHKDSHRFNMPPVVPAGDSDEQLEQLRSFLRNRLGTLMAITIDRAPQSLLATLVHQSATIASADAATEREHPGRPELKSDSVIGALLDGPIAAAVAGAQRAPSRMEMLRAVVADPGSRGDVPVAQLVSNDVTRARTADSVKRQEVLWGRGRDRFSEIGPAWTRELVELDTALEHLATLSAEQLELLLHEHLDLSSHRLDAWVTSLATKRLNGMRVVRPAGLHIGAYGWVENLHPDAGAPPPGAGYLHAPSLQHAATAALLKAGHVAHRGGTGERPFAIDLSGDRVRGAVGAFEAMSEGQTLGAVLGYRLERRLHEALDAENEVLAQYVEPLRRLAPLAPPSVLEPPDETDEAIPANNVVDGVRLLERRQRDAGWAGVLGELRPATARHRELLTRALDALAADADAAADVLLAESIHQFCLGNVDRSSAAMSVLSGQAAPPAALEVLKTPRNGTSITHRLVIAADAARAPAGWAKTPRAAAEPRMNAWAGAILGKPSQIKIRVKASGGARPDEFALAELQLAPLDVVHLCDAESPTDTSLAALARLHVAANPAEVADIKLEPSRSFEWSIDTIGLHELTELARTLRRLLALARPADASAFAPADRRQAAHGINLKELRARARAAVKTFASEIAKADARLRALDARRRPAQASAARKALVPLWLRGHGVNPALLVEPEALLDHGLRLLETLEAQLEKAERAFRAAAEGTEEQASGTYLRVFAAVFGEDFRVAPVLTAAAARRQIFAKVDADREAVSAWLGGMSAVRPAAGVFADLELYMSTLDAGVTFVAGQQPADRTRTAPWVATAGVDSSNSGAIGIVACAPDVIDWGKQVAALVVDEWSELIPAARQTTGVAFHANGPGARPPQAILLAVHPAPGQPWDREILEATLLSTLELSKARAVDLECVGWVGRFLPALYLPTAKLDQVPHLPIRDIVRNFASAPIRETLKP